MKRYLCTRTSNIKKSIIIKKKRGNYIFYEHIDKYLKYEKFCIDDNNCDPYRDKCKFKKSTSDEKSDIHTNICKRFKYLIHNIFNVMPQHKSSNEEADGKYLIYWLNHEIHLRDANICPKSFYQIMRTLDPEDNLLPILRNYMYYIEENEVNNMHNLFYIYQRYNDFKKIMDSENPNKDTAMKYIANCVGKYKELKAKSSEKTTYLSKALNIFKTKYEQTKLNMATHPEWKIENFPSLDDIVDVQEKGTAPPNINSYRVEIATEPSISQEQPVLTLSTSEATLSHPEARIDQFAETVVVQAESGESNHSPQIQSFQSGNNPVRSEENGSTGLKGEGDLSDYTRTIIGPAIGTIGLSSIFFIFYKVK
ncbi:hypothetical protein PVBG_05452 [Plasmodium vivax Brazil I]|uniref:Uncharacterized protein n=1 Tax=Plasmodium vivax (strain Brazil I) TaxID=1033975 RepID=A0A0J9VH99_PLAV1|nr:hypothetical protein PVBG_05452 [Plasmodium vivax Brazil I]